MRTYPLLAVEERYARVQAIRVMVHLLKQVRVRTVGEIVVNNVVAFCSIMGHQIATVVHIQIALTTARRKQSTIVCLVMHYVLFVPTCHCPLTGAVR